MKEFILNDSKNRIRYHDFPGAGTPIILYLSQPLKEKLFHGEKYSIHFFTDYINWGNKSA
jgi:hypothetical protein